MVRRGDKVEEIFCIGKGGRDVARSIGEAVEEEDN
jgi:hypothetical protein